MAITTKNSGAYASIVGVTHKAAGTYAAVQGIYAKVSGAYSSVLSSVIEVTQTPPLFFDDFETPTGSLTGRTGWTVQGDATKAAKIVASAGIARLTTTINGEGPYGFQVTSASPSANRSVEFSYDYSQQGADLNDTATPYKKYDQLYYLAFADESNCTFFEVTPGLSRLELKKTVGGSTSTIVAYVGIPVAATCRFEFRDDRYRLYLNGDIWTPDQGHLDAEAVYPDRLFTGTVPRTGGAALRHSFYALALTKHIQVEDLSVMRVNDLKGFYGRDDTGKRTIAIGGVYSGTPTSWVWRLRKVSDGSTAKDWAALTATAGSGTWSASIDVAAGGPYYLDVGWTGGDGETRVATSNPFSVGILIMAYGQSLATGMSDTGGNFTDISDQYYGFNSSPTYAASTYRTWISAANKPFPAGFIINGMGLSKSLSDANANGIPVAMAACGGVGKPIEELKPGSTIWNTVLLPYITEIGGNIEHFLWLHGEAHGLALSDYSNYIPDFGLVRTGLLSEGGRTGSKILLHIIGKETGSSNSPAETARAQAVRSILLSLPGLYSDVHISHAVLGIPYGDTVHPSNPGTIELARRAGLSVAYHAYGTSAYDGRGPLVTAAARSGSTITLTLNLNGATSVSGSALTGYAVSADDFATTLTINSATVSGSTIVLTLSTAPGAAVKVRSFREQAFNDTSLAVGNYADGTTIPVFPIVDPLTTN